MSGYSLDLRKKIVESVKKGVPEAETARCFGVDRATVKRYCKQLDGRGTLEPTKAPGRAPKQVAAERDEFLRLLWRTGVGRIDPDRSVFVDEMGTHTSLAPLYAYAPVGKRALFEIPRNRGKNTTLLTSLHQGGMGPSMGWGDLIRFSVHEKETPNGPPRRGMGLPESSFPPSKSDG